MSVLSLSNANRFTNPIEFHPDAEEKLERHTGNFKEILKLQTQIVAQQHGDEQILTRHVIIALELLEKRERQQSTMKEGAQIVGASLLGIASSYLLVEPLSAWMTPYTMFYTGCVGMLLIVWGVYRKKTY